jgi:hypothetical protein
MLVDSVEGIAHLQLALLNRASVVRRPGLDAACWSIEGGITSLVCVKGIRAL